MTGAHAATYYFTGTSDYADYTDAANWLVGGPDGTAATDLPGLGDTLYTLSPIYADMAGGDYSVGKWGFSSDWDHSPQPLYVRNGTLRITDNLTTHSGKLVMTDGGNVYVEGTYVPAIWDGGAHQVEVNDGCTYGITGPYQLYKTYVTVNPGGTFLFRPTSFSVYGGSAQSSWYDIYGTMDAPSGVNWASGNFANDSCSVDFCLRDGGVMRLGAGFSQTPGTGHLRFFWYGGTLSVTGSVSFVNVDATIADSANAYLDVGEGGSIDFAGMTIGAGATVTKIGVYDFPFTNGMVLPDAFTVAEGSLALTSAGSYDISGVRFAPGGSVKIGASGVTLTAWDSSLLSYGSFVSGIASPVVGSTLFTCSDASVLAFAKTGLDATLPEGFAVLIEGSSLVVSSAYVFDSTTVTDLNDPAGWSGRAVPVGKVVTIKGAGVAPTTTTLPEFAGVTVMDGASLTVANGGTIPALTLADSAALTVASGTLVLETAPVVTPSGSARPSVTINSGAALEVPGGTAFTDCDLTVSGTLSAATAGDLTLGCAAAGATSVFGLTVNGGTIATTSGNIGFFCPAAGGTVSASGPIIVRQATFAHDDDHGFNFGVNNPASEAVSFVFDGTRLDYPKKGYYTITGGSSLAFVNGGSLYRANSQNDNFTLTVSGLASIFLGEGTTSLIGESSNSAGSVGNGAMTFSPDTDGFVSLVISNATWETYHSAGNGKAVAEIYGNSVHTINQHNWNRTQPFDGFKAVNLNGEATLTISNNVDAASMNFAENFTGSGSLVFSTPRSTTRTFNWNGTTSAATGTLAVDASRPTALVLSTTATWGGTVVWNGKASINHSATADAMTLGGIALASDFNVRLWANDGACDHYTLTGAGFVDGGGLLTVTVVDGGEATTGDSFTIARIPVDSFVPSVQGSAWTLSARAVAGDDTVLDLVLSPASTDYIFESDGNADLCAAAGWATGSVPTNQDVKVSGATTVATVTDATAFPAFSSIAVRNGATLKILADVTLPPLVVDSTSRVVIGDNVAQSAVSATLDAALSTVYAVSGESVALPVIEIATNATLTVASGMKFKNVDFRLYGTVTKASDDDYTPVFGYAENGETSYLAFTADGGVFDFHDNQSAERGSVSFVYPASGGTVVPVGDIVLRNARRRVASWADFGNWEFGRNNPTTVPFNVLADGTPIDVAAYLYVSGAARLSLVNGAYIRRNAGCLGHWFPMAIQDSACVTVGKGAFIDFTTGGGANFAIDSQSAVDAVTVRDGGIFNVSYNSSGWANGVFVSDGGVLGVSKLYQSRGRTDLLRGFGSARLDGELAVSSVDIGTGDTDWNRHSRMADIPFTGTGNVVVTNGVPAYPFTVTMVNGANTASGSIRVAKVAGDAETALYFSDGANWAGSVVAGHVALTNLTDGAAAASVTFGALDLAADFPIRVWKSDGVYSADAITVGSFVNNGGKLKPVMMSEGEEFEKGDSFVVGKIAKDAALPAVATGWAIKARPINGDDVNDEIVITSGVGLQIIIR